MHPAADTSLEPPDSIPHTCIGQQVLQVCGRSLEVRDYTSHRSSFQGFSTRHGLIHNSTRQKAQTWLPFNRHSLDKYAYVRDETYVMLNLVWLSHLRSSISKVKNWWTRVYSRYPRDFARIIIEKYLSLHFSSMKRKAFLMVDSEILYSWYNIRERFILAKIRKIRQNKNSPNYNFIQLIHCIQYIELYRAEGWKIAKLKLGQISRLQIRQNSATSN